MCDQANCAVCRNKGPIPAIITGFCAQMSTFVQTPAMKARGLEVAAAGLHIDCREVYDSALRVKWEANVIVPVHDPMFMKMDRIG